MDLDHQRQLRAAELQAALPNFPASGRVLEIGAGAGWQAALLAQQGFSVEAIEVAGTAFQELAEGRVWPIVEYDGQTIPYEDRSFDVVFSSNVLEHVPHVERLLDELGRVLQDQGVCIHVLPTPTWRAWTNLTHYGFTARRHLARLAAGIASAGAGHRAPVGTIFGRVMPRCSKPWPRRVAENVFPPRHGHSGNALSECYRFSRFYWTRCLRRTGWQVHQVYPAGVFYTGYSVLGSRLSMRCRQRLCRVLGSACLVYVLGKSKRNCPKACNCSAAERPRSVPPHPGPSRSPESQATPATDRPLENSTTRLEPQDPAWQAE
jgi:SAM-dependent methyltransferase